MWLDSLRFKHFGGGRPGFGKGGSFMNHTPRPREGGHKKTKSKKCLPTCSPGYQIQRSCVTTLAFDRRIQDERLAATRKRENQKRSLRGLGPSYWNQTSYGRPKVMKTCLSLPYWAPMSLQCESPPHLGWRLMLLAWERHAIAQKQEFRKQERVLAR